MALSTKNRREEGWEGRWRKILVRQCTQRARFHLCQTTTRQRVLGRLRTDPDRLGGPHLLPLGTGRARSDGVCPQRLVQEGVGRRSQRGGGPPLSRDTGGSQQHDRGGLSS